MKLPISLALMSVAVTLTYASASRADDSTTQVQPSTTTVVPTAPAPQPQPQPQITVVQPPPAATTTTTAGRYVPEGGDLYQEREVSIRPNRPMLSAGAGLFVLSYGASAVTAAVSARDADKNLFIPIAGPWIDLADRGCDARDCGDREDVVKAMLITSGIVQGAGVLIAVGSLIIPEKVEERRVASTKPTLRLTPLSYRGGAGVGAFGTF